MNLIYIIQVQDGDSRRKEFQAETLPSTATHEEINAKGEEVLRERFTGNDEGEWCWDSYNEKAGRYYSVKIIPCDESFEIIKEIFI